MDTMKGLLMGIMGLARDMAYECAMEARKKLGMDAVAENEDKDDDEYNEDEYNEDEYNEDEDIYEDDDDEDNDDYYDDEDGDDEYDDEDDDDEDSDDEEKRPEGIEIVARIEEKDKQTLVLDLSGYEKEKISVALESSEIVVKAEGGGNWALPNKESKFFVASNIDKEKIEVSYCNGALEIVLPKKEIISFEIKEKNTIKVSSLSEMESTIEKALEV